MNLFEILSFVLWRLSCGQKAWYFDKENYPYNCFQQAVCGLPTMADDQHLIKMSLFLDHVVCTTEGLKCN